MTYDSIASASAALSSRETTSLALTRECLDSIAALDGSLNAFISVFSDSSLKQAAELDDELRRGELRGPLHGIPLALKDNIDVAGELTTAGSRVLATNRAKSDAVVTRRLKQAGAVILGKTNMHEFAYGGSGVISAYGPTRNPLETKRITGGSSSGSAAAVAAGMCLAALGTDTAGSVRLPASLCGLVGLKPTFGLVSVEGTIPLADSQDHIGPITRTVADAEMILQILAGDSHPDRGRTAGSVRIAVAREFFCEGLQNEIAQAFERGVEVVAQLGSLVGDVQVPVNTERTLREAEAFWYHSQFLEQHANDYDPQTLQRIRNGEATPKSAIPALRAQLDAFRQDSLRVFGDVDFILTPTVPIEAPELDSLINSPDLRITELLLLRNTRPFNLLGWPAITLPCGRTESGMPCGLQISAGLNRDWDLLEFAKQVEKKLREAGL